MKIKIVSAIILMLFLFGCAGPAGIGEQSTSDNSTVLAAGMETASETSQGTAESISTEETSGTYTNGTAADAGSAASTPNGTNKSSTEAAKPAGTTVPQTTILPGNTVRLYISCINAVKYGKRNEPGYDRIIPEDGVILDTTAELQENDTVLSLLKRVLQEKGIALKNQRSYIEGIGGLEDSVCGGTSGWLYSVNGVFPGYGSDQYSLKSGDEIKFLYSVESGDVTDLSAWN